MKKSIFTLFFVFVGFVFANGQGAISPSDEIQVRQEMLRKSYAQNLEFCTELKQQITDIESPERTAQELLKQMSNIPAGQEEQIVAQLKEQITNKQILAHEKYASDEQFREASFRWHSFDQLHCKELLNGQTRTDWKKAIQQDIRYFQQELEKENQLSNRSSSPVLPSPKPINWMLWIGLLAIPLLVVCGLLWFTRKK